MFNSDFYPTPDYVLDALGIDCHDKIVLEPSAGKGNIIDWLFQNGASGVMACETNKDLAAICRSKATRFIREDFLQVVPEEISHVDMIVMNPPFSAGVKHLLHAWEISPGGCEIFCLLNSSNLENDYSHERRQLNRIIESNGSSQELGSVFVDAERTTNVEVSLIKLYKPASGQTEFAGFFMEEDEEQENTTSGIMKYDAVKEIVQRYVNSIKKYDQFESLQSEINILCDPFGMKMENFRGERDREINTREEFKKEVQKRAWKHIFKKLELDKYVTSGVSKEINNFVEKQTNVPFTMKNIYRMLEIIVGTRENTFNKSLEEAIDHFTMHTKDNRYHVEGWVTNSGYMLNRKFIVGYVLEREINGGWLNQRWSSRSDGVDDLIKVMCSITGTNYYEIPNLRDFCRQVKMQPGVWYDWQMSEPKAFEKYLEKVWKRMGQPGDREEFVREYSNNKYYIEEFKKEPIKCFFQIKGFLKGTLHMKFKNVSDWEAVNRKYAQIKGQVIPEKFV